MLDWIWIPVALCAFIWLAILLLPWQPWRSKPILHIIPPEVPPPSDAGITVVIPARNEAAVIGRTLTALAGQGLAVILVDDNSTDGTADAARSVPGLDLEIISGQPLPPGWSGKLWALAQGVRRARTPLVLMIDADIAVGPGVVAALLRHQRRGLALVSIMAALSMISFWEKLLLPTFIYFFKMLYPFILANSPDRRFASAAGGCMLVEKSALDQIGGLESIRSAVIDDCALAARIKQAGLRTWTGQSRQVKSIRPYAGLGEIWNMVARTAYTQLNYSVFWLALCTIGLIFLFWLPLLGLPFGDERVRWLGLLAWLEMASSYLPTLTFYELSPAWALLMPVSAALYLGMSWTSALRYWRGERTRWKGRVYPQTLDF
jgi:hopene-associated glycosyltransferase HpnB